jgi:hypothetical protein
MTYLLQACESGSLNCAEWLLAQTNVPYNELRACSPQHVSWSYEIALRRGYFHVTKWLRNTFGTDVDNRFKGNYRSYSVSF